MNFSLSLLDLDVFSKEQTYKLFLCNVFNTQDKMDWSLLSVEYTKGDWSVAVAGYKVK